MKKKLSGKKAYVGEFDPGTYTVLIEPMPPQGETLGPIHYIDNPKFNRKVTLTGTDHYLNIIITRKESIEYNIMMTFLVEDGLVTPADKPFFEFSTQSSNTIDQPHIKYYAEEFGLNEDLVNAICYMETTHGWYDIIKPNPDSIRPMNINIVAWEKLLAARGVTRAELEKRDVNIREGCFLLHRLYVRANPKSLLAVASLYNAHKAEYLSEYGYHVKRIYDQKLWIADEAEPGVDVFDDW